MDFAEIAAFAARHQILAFALGGLTLAIIGNEVAGLFKGYKAINPADLTALVNRENALVVDLRPIAEFEKGHVPGAKNVQMSQFDPENRALAAAKSLPVVLVCKAGQTSGDAAKRLRKAGFEKVFVLDGGIGAWQQAGLPLARGR